MKIAANAGGGKMLTLNVVEDEDAVEAEADTDEEAAYMAATTPP